MYFEFTLYSWGTGIYVYVTRYPEYSEWKSIDDSRRLIY